MSDRDKLVVLGLFFIFLISFFVLFILFDNKQDSRLFQYLFFIAALTMAFTGFLGATGTFTTQGQTLGGGAAIFLIMIVAVVGLKPYFATDNYMLDIVDATKSSPTEELSEEAAVKRTKDTFEEMRNVRQLLKIGQEEPLERVSIVLKKTCSAATVCPAREMLKMVIRSLKPPRIIKTTDGKFNVSLGDKPVITKEGKYEFSMAELQAEMIFLQTLSNNIKLNDLVLMYNDNVPELQLYVTEEK